MWWFHRNICVITCVDCKTVGFFLKISKQIGKAWRKSLTRANRAGLTRPVSLFVFSLDLLFHCSRVLEYAKIGTVLQSITCDIRAQFWKSAAQRISKQNGVGNYLHWRWISSIFCHYFKENRKRRFWATRVNRKWTFCTPEPWFWTNFGVNRLFKKKTLSNKNLVLPRHTLKRKRLTSGWTTSLKNVGCLNSLLTSNVRTVNGTQIVIITGVRLLLFLIGMKDTGAWFLNENEGECSDVHP